ncbi:MAG: hypothetical protein OXT69_00120 [Candidatus Poribacteria bacterium]|nr:hypothetical protein [Candidatus Poribacteria bacterium]
MEMAKIGAAIGKSQRNDLFMMILNSFGCFRLPSTDGLNMTILPNLSGDVIQQASASPRSLSRQPNEAALF